MPYIKIWIHAVWTTKNKEPFLKKEIRKDVFQHIREYADEKGIYIDFINGYIDHVHCLISLDSSQSIADIMQMIKGESSYWINKHKLVEGGFAWQNDYYAESIGKSDIKRVRSYIKNQEEHHSSVTFEEEEKTLPRVETRGN